MVWAGCSETNGVSAPTQSRLMRRTFRLPATPPSRLSLTLCYDLHLCIDSVTFATSLVWSAISFCDIRRHASSFTRVLTGKGIKFSTNRRVIAFTAKDTFQLWDVQTGALQQTSVHSRPKVNQKGTPYINYELSILPYYPPFKNPHSA